MGKLDQVARVIGSLEKGQKILLKSTEVIEKHVKEINGAVFDHKARIEELERHKWTGKKVVVALTGIAALVGIFVALFQFVVSAGF